MKIKLMVTVEGHDGNIGYISTDANLYMPILATTNGQLRIKTINDVMIDCMPDEREEHSDE